MIEQETYSATGTTTGTRLHTVVLVWRQDWLGVSEYREPGWRPSVDSGAECTAELGVMSTLKKGTLFLTDAGNHCLHNFRASECLVWFCVCVCMCVFLILEWIMRCKENSTYSELYSNLYMFLYERNLLRTFIFKIQKCFKVLVST